MLRGGGAASRPTAIPEVDRHPRPSDKGLFAPSPAEGEAVQKGRPSQSTCGSRLTSRSRSFTAPHSSPSPRQSRRLTGHDAQSSLLPPRFCREI